MANIITKDVMEKLELSRLDDETRNEIMQIKQSLDITSAESIMNFGASASKNVTDFSKEMLKNFKIKDIPEVEEILPILQTAFNEVDTSSLLPKKKGILGKFFKGVDVNTFIQRFENVEQIVMDIQKKMQRVHYEIQRDIETERLMGEQNIEYIKHLDCAIFALRMAYNEEKQKVEQEEAITDRSDVLAMHILTERKEQLLRMERQAYNLETQRVQAVQTLPVIKTIIDGNIGLAGNINMAITQSIPTWERNILIALQLHRQQGSLRIERAVHEMTNNLIKKNSSMLRENATEIAKAVESGLIDIDALEEANKNIIMTAESICKIQEEAIKTRKENMEKLNKMVQGIIDSESIKKVAGTTFEVIDAH